MAFEGRKRGKGESFFLLPHTHQPTQKLDWKQRKTIRHTKLETFREKACHSRHFICILDPKKSFVDDECYVTSFPKVSKEPMNQSVNPTWTIYSLCRSTSREKSFLCSSDIDFSLLKRGKKISPEKAFRGFREGFLTSHERLIKGHLVRRPYVVKGSV